jgi:hypothetical protein
MKLNFTLFRLMPLLFLVTFASANITGEVYKDFNLNGVKDGEDVGVPGIAITAACQDGSTPSAVTDANGNYVITVATAGNQCRIEADPSSVGFDSSANALGSSPLVDMVSDNSIHKISIASPASYCQVNPDIVMAALPGGEDPDPKTFGSLFSVPAPDAGVSVNSQRM